MLRWFQNALGLTLTLPRSFGILQFGAHRLTAALQHVVSRFALQDYVGSVVQLTGVRKMTNIIRARVLAISAICLSQMAILGPGCTGAMATASKDDCVERAMELYDQGDLEGACVEFDQAAKEHPSDWKIYSDRGAIFAQLGNNEDAMADFNKSISFNPPSAKPYFNRGKLESELGLPEKAIKDYDVAFKYNKHEPMILNNRANDKVALGDIKGAIADYKLAIKLDSEYAEPYNGLGVLLKEQGDAKDAVAMFSKAIQRDPDFAKAFYNRHTCYLTTGDRNSAIADLKRCAEIYEAQGELETSEQMFDDAKALL
jgi:tetratricopeptide (TPR) repeat protein